MSTPHISVAAANSTSYTPLVHVSGTGGVLTGVGIAGGPSYHIFRITLDFATLADDYLCGSMGGRGSAHQNNGVGISLPFENDLLVEVREGVTPSAVSRYWAAYVTDSSKLVGEPEKYSDGDHMYERAEYADEDRETTYTIDSLRGPKRYSRVSLNDDTYFLEEEPFLVGVVSVFDLESDQPTQASSVDLLIRPLGRTTKIQSIYVGDVDGEHAFEDRLERQVRGDFEIVADLDSFANLPTTFTVL